MELFFGVNFSKWNLINFDRILCKSSENSEKINGCEKCCWRKVAEVKFNKIWKFANFPSCEILLRPTPSQRINGHFVFRERESEVSWERVKVSQEKKESGWMKVGECRKEQLLRKAAENRSRSKSDPIWICLRASRANFNARNSVKCKFRLKFLQKKKMLHKLAFYSSALGEF